MEVMELLKVAGLVNIADHIDGRVRLQKIVYLLEQLGYDLPFDDFLIRQHGPYSRALASSVDTLCEAGILNEAVEKVRGSEMYVYSVTDASKGWVDDISVAEASGRSISDDITALLERTRSVLEVAATRVYLQREDELSGDELEKELALLKGHLKTSFAEAKEFADELVGTN